MQSGGTGSIGRAKSLGGRSVAMLANDGQFVASYPSGSAGEMPMASEVRAAT